MIPQEVMAVASRSKRSKNKKKNKTRTKSMKRISSIDCVDNKLQSVVTYVYISSMT
jgi:hypothetical protein